MNEKDGFLKAIIANPDDDLPRLVYADWLEENGEGARAEFIRVQIKLATYEDYSCWLYGMPILITDALVPPCECRWCELKFRERELLNAYSLTWLPQPLVDLESEYARDVCVYRRGFVEQLTCTAAEWLAYADALTAMTPLREVTLMTTLDWYLDGAAIILHVGRHPIVIPPLYRCQRAMAVGDCTHASDINSILAAEWLGITFRNIHAILSRTARQILEAPAGEDCRAGQLMQLRNPTQAQTGGPLTWEEV